MLIREILLAFIGLCSGLAVAAGVFAFITMLGVVPRLAHRTHTALHIVGYETVIILGGSLGNVVYLYAVPLPFTPLFLAIFGLAVGTYIGCLAMALAEQLRVIPVFVERSKLVVGLPFIILSIAFGKMFGTFFQFFFTTR